MRDTQLNTLENACHTPRRSVILCSFLVLFLSMAATNSAHAGGLVDKAKSKGKQAAAKAKSTAGKAATAAKEAAGKVADGAKAAGEKAAEKAEEAKDAAKDAAGNVLEQILAAVNDARNKATEVKETVGEVRDKVREGVQQLTGDVRTMLDTTVGQAKDKIAQHVAGLKEFEGAGCEDFRTRLIDLMLGLEALSASVQDTVLCEGTAPLIDFSQEIALIEKLPCGLLFPVSKINLPPCLVDKIYNALDGLATLQDLMARDKVLLPEPELELDIDPLVLQSLLSGAPAEAEPNNSDVVEFSDGTIPGFDGHVIVDAEVQSAKMWLENYVQVKNALKSIRELKMALSALSTLFDALGEFNFEANIGIHGYAIVTLDNNMLKKWSSYAETLSNHLKSLGEWAKPKMKNAFDIATRAQIMANQRAILANQRAQMTGTGLLNEE